MSITIYSRELDESFTFTMPSDGGYVRVIDGRGGPNQIFNRNGSAVSAYSDKELHEHAKAYVRRVVAAET